jgi:hypothetical protein
MDEPKAGETHEVTVQLDGPCDKKTFEEYRDALKECLDRLARVYGVKRVRRIVRSVPAPSQEAP